MGASHHFRVIYILSEMTFHLNSCPPPHPCRPREFWTSTSHPGGAQCCTQGEEPSWQLLFWKERGKGLLSCLPERAGLWVPNAKRFCFLPECGYWKTKLWLSNWLLAFSFSTSWRHWIANTWCQVALYLRVLSWAGSSLHAISAQAAYRECRSISGSWCFLFCGQMPKS